MAGRGPLGALAGGAWSAALFLRARQDREPGLLLTAAVFAALAAAASETVLALPLVLGATELMSAHRYRPLRIRLRTTITTVVVSGALDPVTPANQGAEAAKHLSNGLHLVFDNGTHGDTAFRPCMDGVYADFYRSGSVEGLDTRCASEVRPIRFAVER